MKRTLFPAVLTLACMLTAGHMQAQGTAAQATVPFAFAVGRAVLPAGTYTFTSDSLSSGILLVRGKEMRQRMAASTVLAGFEDSTGEGKLVFHRIGDRYFLSAVVCPDAGLNLRLPTSKLEKRAQMREARLEHGEEVLLAFNGLR